MAKADYSQPKSIDSTRSYVSRRELWIPLLTVVASHGARAQTGRWLVYYSNSAPAGSFDSYQLLILDSRYHPVLAPLSKAGKKLVGYLSLGEAAEDYSYYGELRSQGLLLRPSPTWKGNQYIDIRDSRWLNRLCEELIPKILEKGFHGLFLDTLDGPLYLEQTNAETYRGMAASAAEIIRTIRRLFPKITIVMNRAYGLLEHVGAEIDAVMGESVFSTYDFEQKKYRLVDPATYRLQLRWLKEAMRRRPELQVLTLDYWDPSDAEGVRRIYKEERANGFLPYVATIDLARVVDEPRIP